MGQHALWRLRAGLGLELGAADPPNGNALLLRQDDDVADDRGVVDVVGEPHVADTPATAEEELAYGLPAFDLLASERPLQRLRSATAQQATPSPRPIEPRPSARLGFTLTGTPDACSRRSSI